VAQFDQHLLDDGTCVVEASGEVDLAVVADLLEVGRDGLSRGRAMCLDLRQVSFIDSTGLGALIVLRNEAAASDKPLRLVNVPAPVTRLLELTGLGTAFDIDGSDTPVHRDS
jgi:anti-anti-sigma factor